MSLNKSVKYLLAAVLVAGMLFAVYGWFDTAVSLDYARQEARLEKNRSDLLRQFVWKSNRTANHTEILSFVRETFGDGHVIKDEKDEIILDNIVFRFDDNQRLSKVLFAESGD
jgi:hypothetical protein